MNPEFSQVTGLTIEIVWVPRFERLSAKQGGARMGRLSYARQKIEDLRTKTIPEALAWFKDRGIKSESVWAGMMCGHNELIEKSLVFLEEHNWVPNGSKVPKRWDEYKRQWEKNRSRENKKAKSALKNFGKEVEKRKSFAKP
jgi:hypothetical protein